ncbi:IMP dehydrogenase [Anaerobacillus sp. HL2]|nr:IMP dehydrogenase [Anaerobacillus sp. HL2]
MYQGRQFKVYRGMGFIRAMEKVEVRSLFPRNNQKLVPEGIEGRVPYKDHLMIQFIINRWWYPCWYGLLWYKDFRRFT